MTKALDIIPECYVDTNLIGYMLDMGVNHQYGCSMVAKTMQLGRNKDGFAIGIVDNDKRKHKYVEEFLPIAASAHLQVLKHPQRHHYFIFIGSQGKAIEDFILSAAQELQYDMTNANLSNDLRKLMKITKDCSSNENFNLRKAFMELREASEMKILRKVLRYLQAEKYNANPEIIRMIFMNPDYDSRQ